MEWINRIVREPRQWQIGGAIAVATLAAYANTFHAPFIFDDLHGILWNTTLSHFGTALHPPENAPLSARPFANLTFAVNRAISGDAVWSYHLGNVAIHISAALMLFGVLRRVFGSPCARAPLVHGFRPELDNTAVLAAAATALTWAVHPLQTEVVTFIVQRSESLMSLLYLVTFYGFLRADASERAGGWYALSVLACGLGMATKEVMYSAPLVVLVYDRCFRTGSFASALRKRRWYYAGLASTWLVLAICLAQSSTRVAGFSAIPAPTAWQYLVTQGIAIAHYLRLVAWPVGQVFDYGYGTIDFGVGPAVAMAGLAAAACGSVWAFIRRRSPVGFAGVCFFLLLAPSSSIVPLAQQTMAEHRMYLALAVPLSIVVYALVAGFGWRAVLAIAMAAFALGELTAHRNGLYNSPLALWKDTTAKRPDNARAWAYLGHAWSDEGQWRQAISACENQLRLDPRYNVDADAIIGRSLVELGRATEALPHLLAAARLAPEDHGVQVNLGVALAAANRLPEAVQAYEAALAADSKSAHAHVNLANALIRLGRVAEAWPHFAAAAKLAPAAVQPELNWAAALGESGDNQAAATHYRLALALDPRSVVARIGLGDIAAKSGDVTSAVAQYEAAIQIDPQSAAAEHNLGVALMQLGRTREGIAHLRRTVELLPDAAEPHMDFATALAQAGHTTAARQECEKALALDPQLAGARELLSQLRGER